MTTLLFLLWLVGALAVVVFACLDVGLEAQIYLGAATVASAVLIGLIRPQGLLRTIFIVFALFVSFRYLAWRTFETLPDVANPGFAPGVILYAAELHGFLMYLLGIFANIRHNDRLAVKLPRDQASYPSVDILIPTFNESPDIVRLTALAARQIDYPADKLKVHVLDDGGTDARIGQPDPFAADEALVRAARLREICEEIGATYMTRLDNFQAKAGNLNAAMRHTHGDLILVLDADHVPAADILQHTVGHFMRDPDVALVQTPHFFLNPDPVERNLDTFDSMPSENEMFYAQVQRGLDFWNASFFCGSAALLRRAHLERIGGLSGRSVTEDAETSIDLHGAGFKSVYVDRPMVAGLAPDTFSAFISQRTRWAQGMVQIMLLKNPLWQRGLSFAQRLCYLNSVLFWLFPLSRVVFITAPLFYLLFGLQIFNTTLIEFAAFVLPHLLIVLVLNNALFGRTRWPFISDLYETAQSLFLSGPVLRTILRPGTPRFRVTPKAEIVGNDFASPYAKPLALLAALLASGMALGIYRYEVAPLEHQHLYIVFAWNLLNIVLVLGALGAAFERTIAHQTCWVRRQTPVRLATKKDHVPATLTGCTMEGCRIALPRAEVTRLDSLRDLLLFVGDATQKRQRRLGVKVVEQREIPGGLQLDLRFADLSPETEADRVWLVYGDSSVWQRFAASRRSRRIVPLSLLWLAVLGLRRALALLAHVMRRRQGEADLLGPASPSPSRPLRIVDYRPAAGMTTGEGD